MQTANALGDRSACSQFPSTRFSLSCSHCASHIDFGHGCPVFALPGQMFTVLEQTLAEFAAQQCVAVLIQPVGEVLE